MAWCAFLALAPAQDFAPRCALRADASPPALGVSSSDPAGAVDAVYRMSAVYETSIEAAGGTSDFGSLDRRWLEGRIADRMAIIHAPLESESLFSINEGVLPGRRSDNQPLPSLLWHLGKDVSAGMNHKVEPSLESSMFAMPGSVTGNVDESGPFGLLLTDSILGNAARMDRNPAGVSFETSMDESDRMSLRTFTRDKGARRRSRTAHPR